MCIKSAPYLHLKSVNQALNKVKFDALSLMLLTNSSEIALLEGAVPASIIKVLMPN